MESEGRCLYCNGLYPQAGIGKHLETHLKKMEVENTKLTRNKYCHVEVQNNEMFLHLLVNGYSSMKVIDRFLRDIWLDCCEHLSGFRDKYGKISMSHRVEDVLQPRRRIYHDYDFGSTTTVMLKAHKHYQLQPGEKIILLSRNEPLKIMCTTCKKKPAVYLCSVCLYETDAFYCEECSETHGEKCDDFFDYAQMPVVNSPRMGECGYTGGTIDIERDGTYKNAKL